MTDNAATTLKYRASCDSCLASKVKCSRTKPVCWRCNQTGQTCLYSPFRKIGRPPKGSTWNTGNQQQRKQQQQQRQDQQQQQQPNPPQPNETETAQQSEPYTVAAPDNSASTSYDGMDLTPWPSAQASPDRENSVDSSDAAGNLDVTLDFELPVTAFAELDSFLDATAAGPFLSPHPTPVYVSTEPSGWPSPVSRPSRTGAAEPCVTAPLACSRRRPSLYGRHSPKGVLGSSSGRSRADGSSHTDGQCSNKCHAMLAGQLARLGRYRLEEPAKLPLDLLLSLDRDAHQAGSRALNCAACLGRTTSRPTLMLVIMTLEHIVGLLEKESDLAADQTRSSRMHELERISPSTLLMLRNDTPLLVGDFEVQGDVKAVFLKQLRRLCLDRLATTLFEVDTAIALNLKDINSRVAREMLTDLRPRILFLQGLVALSS